jgi:hypothetical protein
MTIMAHHFDIGCNECGDWRAVTANTAGAARRSLKAKGWVKISECGRINDLCPMCAGQWRATKLAIKAERQRERYQKVSNPQQHQFKTKKESHV